MIEPLSEADEARIRDWFDAIGETDPQTIAELLERARRETRARAYLLAQAEAAAEAALGDPSCPSCAGARGGCKWCMAGSTRCPRCDGEGCRWCGSETERGSA